MFRSVSSDLLLQKRRSLTCCNNSVCPSLSIQQLRTDTPEIPEVHDDDIMTTVTVIPILYGEDARRFEARMQERRRISMEERTRINAAYEAVKSVCDFM
jgi:hypothetical protein